MVNAKIDYYEHTIDSDGNDDADDAANDVADNTASSPYSILPTDEDRETIINDALDELADIARENILEFKREDFDDKAVIGTWIDSYLCQYFSEIDPHSSNFSTTTAAEAAALNDVIDAYIRELYNDIFERFYEEITPPRVSLATHPPSLDAATVQYFASKIQTLREKPQPEQRTPEWYSRRNNLITASAASKAFGSQASMNQLIYEKCKNYAPVGGVLEDGGGGGGGGGIPMQGSVNSPLHWGQRYEPLTVMIYEHRNKTQLGEFGCIQHDTYPFIGASPDGINIDPTSAIYGRMVEIKNIVNREITGHPKEEYWIQTQIQMEVCDLDECDFVETRFKEYDSEADYLAADSSDSSCPNEKGVILWFQTAPALTQHGYVSPPIQLYEYAPIGVSLVEYERWEAEMFAKHERLRSIWVRTIYWYLDQYSCVLVRRNRLWFQEAVPLLQKLWNTVEEERKSGYEHRAPKRKTATATATATGAATDENNIKIVKLNTTIMPEDSQEVTSTNMATLITQQQQQQQQPHANKYRQNVIKGPSDVLIKCFKIDDLEMDDSKIEQ